MANAVKEYILLANKGYVRFILFISLFFSLSGIGTYIVYSQFADKNLVLDSRLFRPQALLSIAALLCVFFIADGLRLYYTLQALGQSIPIHKALKLVFVNFFFSNITPLATGGGFAQILYLRRHGVAFGIGTAATTIRTVLAIVFIFSLTPIFLFTLDVFKGQPLIEKVNETLTVFVILYLVFFAIIILRARWVIVALSAILNGIHRLHLLRESRCTRLKNRMFREFLLFSHSFVKYLNGPKWYVLGSIFFTFLFLVSLFSFPALLISCLGYKVDYIESIGLIVVTTLILYFAPTPGASGISEGVFGNFFSGILSAEHLVLVLIAWRFVTIYLAMIIGLFIIQLDLASKRYAP